MRTSRRVMLSLACVLLAIAPLFLLSLRGLIGHHTQPLGQFLRNSAEIFPVYFLFALPGWLIALPFVVLLKDAEGWRGWFILLVGICIGPGFIWIWIWMASPVHYVAWQRDGFPLVLSLIISFLTTLSYFLALKFAHRRSIASER